MSEDVPAHTLEVMLADIVWPALRREGFRRGHGTFVREDRTGWVAVNLRSARMRPGHFLVDAGAIPALLAPQASRRLRPSVVWNAIAPYARPLAALSRHRDQVHFWPCTSEAAQAVVRIFVEEALPKLQVLATAEGMRDLLLTGHFSAMTPPERSDLVRLLAATGMEEEAALLRQRTNEPRSLDPALPSELAAAITELEAVGWRFD